MYKIGEFSKLVKIPVKTLRYYDQINLFVPSKIEQFTGYRYYSFQQIFDAKMILKLKDLGLSLEEIKEFLKTNDMNILFNKQNEYKEKINNIKKYIDNKYNNYKVVIGSYDDYILYNGLRSAKSNYALSIKDNIMRYFIIKCGSLFVDDFTISGVQNRVCGVELLNYHFFEDNLYVDFVFNSLKEYGYEFITISFLANWSEFEDQSIFNMRNNIGNKFKNVEEFSEKEGNFENIIFKIYL